MFKYLKYNVLILFTLLNMGSCEEKIVPSGNIVPTISFVSISNIKMKQFTDTLSIKLHYEDGDGDLGDIHPDSMSFFVRDTRLNFPDRYHLLPLSPNSAKVNIEGDLVLKLKNIFLLSPSPSENTTFEIKVKDRSNHMSNVIFTPKIEIIR